MNGQLITSLVGIFFGLLGAMALLWAVSHRQFRASEATRYAVREDEPDYSDRAPASPLSRRVFMVVLVTIFTAILLSPVVTIMAAMSPGTHSSSGAAAKCPFGFGK